MLNRGKVLKKIDSLIFKLISDYSYLIFLILATGVLALYAYAFRFVYPQGDDYFLLGDWKNAAWRDYLDVYFFKTGPRFTSWLIFRVFAVFCENLFLLRLFLLLLTATFVYLIFRTIRFFGVFQSKRDEVVVSIALFLVYLNQLPDIASGFYWWCSFIVFQLPLLLFLIFIILLKRIPFDNINLRQNIRNLGLLFFLLTFIIGSNELFVFQILFILGFLFLYAKAFSVNRRLLILFIAYGVALVILNYRGFGEGRIELNRNSGNIAYAISRGLTEFYSYLKTWIGPAFILLIFYVFNTIRPLSRKIKGISVSATLFIAFLFLLLQFILLFFAVGSAYVPYRTINTFLFFFIFSAVFVIVLMKSCPVFSITYSDKLKRFLNGIILLLFLYFIITGGTTKALIKDYTDHRLTSYRNQMQERENIVKNGTSRDAYTFRKLDNVPTTLFWHDITGDSTYYFNRWFSYYHRIQSVRLEE